MAAARTEAIDDASANRANGAQRPTRIGMIRLSAAVLALALVGAAAAVGCGDDDEDDHAPAATTAASLTKVTATEADGTIILDAASSDGGSVEFTIRNTGKLTHEFVVLKTDLAEDKLPLTADGSAVDESGTGVAGAGERESIAAGSEAELSLDGLAPGNYVIICNVPGHYGLGMHTPFTVR